MDCIACRAPLSLGILQERILEWVAMSSSRGSSQPRDRTPVSCIAGQILYQLSYEGSPESINGVLQILDYIQLTELYKWYFIFLIFSFFFHMIYS